MNNQRLYIKGKKNISGEVFIYGAKNSILPLLAASYLTKNKVVFANIPIIEDCLEKINCMKKNGAEIEFLEERVIEIKAKNINNYFNPSSIRTLILFLGPILNRLQNAKIPFPMGDKIGFRNINYHIDLLEKMGAKFTYDEGFIYASCENCLQAIGYTLDFPSVGATQQFILSAAIANGISILNNAAVEPEIKELCDFLTLMNLKIQGIGSSKLVIHGTGGKLLNHKKIYNYTLNSDRLQAVTYLLMPLLNGGEIHVEGKNLIENLGHVLHDLCDLGAEITLQKNKIKLLYKENKKINYFEIKTGVFPQFNTDYQPLFAPVLCLRAHKSKISDYIFSERFKYVTELNKMSSKINFINNNSIEILGIEQFSGQKNLISWDIRAGAAVLLACLSTNEESEISNTYQIFRGYDNLLINLNSLDIEIKEFQLESKDQGLKNII
jgi:UDP-N-acetylglucosamine 1-carboxyvinyltransferase